MSITFTPNTGTWTEHNYYIADPDDVASYGNDTKHGVTCYEQECPVVECHNGGAYWLLQTVGLHQESCGEATSGEVDHLLAKIHNALAAEMQLNFQRGHIAAEDNYNVRKLNAFKAMLLHCKYHGCGFSWG